jgi:hypothetical protein
MKKEKVISVEESLYSIACRLDELTGNAMGNSYLKLDMEPIELDRVEDRLTELNEKVDELIGAVSDISVELQSLSTISETLENMLGWYIEFNQNKKTK